MEVDEEDLGSPHIMVALAVLPVIAMVAGMSPAGAMAMKNWWEGKILDKTEEEIAREIPVFRVRKPQVATTQKKGKKKVPAVPYAKIQIAIKDYAIMEIISQIPVKGGGMEKAGPAPRGFLERQARDLMDKVSRHKK